MLTIDKRILALCVVLPLAACGDDDGGGGNETGPDATVAVDCFDESAFFSETSANNLVSTDPELTDVLNLTEPNFAPATGSPVLSGGATPPAGFDTTATFIGAIGAEDWTAGWTAYPTDTSGPSLVNVENKVGEITADEMWTKDTTYVLTGPVFVTGGATLTIEAGTMVRGMSGSALVIAANGSINATGTAAEPIVFTSNNDTGAAPGDWGGVVLLGNAPINVTGGTDSVEGFAGQSATIQFGGSDASHDCGTLSYVRIEYAGFELSTDNELNGLTVAGCGADTELSFIQVHLGEDDGIEFFGGTAGITNAVITLADDDSLDWDMGWTGKVQFLIVQQSSTRGDNGFESDNNGNDNDATPRSAPEIWNATLIGGGGPVADDQGGMTLRRGTAGTISNAIIAHFASFAVDVADFSTVEQARAGDLAITDSYFFDNGGGDNWPNNFDGATAEQNDCDN